MASASGTEIRFVSPSRAISVSASFQYTIEVCAAAISLSAGMSSRAHVTANTITALITATRPTVRAEPRTNLHDGMNLVHPCRARRG